MRKLVLHIVFFTSMVLLFSCASENMEEPTSMATATENRKAIAVNDDMGLEKKNDSKLIELTSEQKEAFQLRAIEKFEDFIDYIKIISDHKVDKTLRAHSLKLALELFVADSTLLSDSTLNDNIEPVQLRNYLAKIDSINKPIIINLKSINFTSPIVADSLLNYNGKMEAVLNINGKKTTKHIDVNLVDVQKKFGKDMQNILEIRLGNIY